MKAILKNDIIIHVTERGDTEIGKLPKGVGLERLRWDGERVVDLADLAQIWVEERNGAFVLHAVEVQNAQKVTMTYADRKRLVQDAGLIRLKTKEEIEFETQEQELKSKVAALTLDDLRILLVHTAKQTGIIEKAPDLSLDVINRIESKIKSH